MPLLAVVALLGLPVLELWVAVQVGRQIGAVPTLLVLLGSGVLGGMLLRVVGRRAWERLRYAVGTGRLPGRELLDGVLVLAGGVLLLAPGFVTDVAGLLLLLPPTRMMARLLLLRALARRLARATVVPGPVVGGPVVGGEVVRGEVVEGHEVRRPDEPS